MAAFLIFDKSKTWFSQSGVLLAGGSLKFYTAGTTTPLAVFGERALTTNNGSTIALDSGGRLAFECWADTANAYFVEVYDSASVKQGEVSYIEVPGGPAQTIPIPLAGEFLTGDGTQLLTATIREVPDPTGNSNKILGTDGTSLLWQAKPADGAAGVANVAVTPTSMKVADMLTQYGTGTGTNVGGRKQSATVTFALPYDSVPVGIKVYVTSTALSSYGNMPGWSVQSISTTDATINFTMGELDDSRSGYDFNAAVAFGYEVTGIKA